MYDLRSSAGFARAIDPAGRSDKRAKRARSVGRGAKPPSESKAGFVDRQAHHELADQLVVGEAALQVLADHVDVLEVALQEMILVDGRRAREVVDSVDDADGQANRVGRGQ